MVWSRGYQVRGHPCKLIGYILPCKRKSKHLPFPLTSQVKRGWLESTLIKAKGKKHPIKLRLKEIV